LTCFELDRLPGFVNVLISNKAMERTMKRKPAPGRTRVNDPAGMRGRVLDAAARSFQLHGYHATSTHDVMRAAGVTGGALHHHFPSKKALAVAVIRERVANAVEQTWIEPVQSARTASAGILGVFKAISKGLDERNVVLGCPLGNLATELSLADADFRRAIQDVFEHWRKTIAQKVRTDCATGALPALDPDAFATFVIASYSGAIALAKAEQSADALTVCARQLATVMRPRRSGGRLSKR
jgi:AcrR family transcriptional regulator